MAKTRITKKDVVHAASLARLKLSKEEIDKFGTELAMVLDFVAKLEEVNIKNVESTSYGGLKGSAFREDMPPLRDIKKEEERKKHLSSAFPDSQEGMLKVPHVLPRKDL